MRRCISSKNRLRSKPALVVCCGAGSALSIPVSSAVSISDIKNFLDVGAMRCSRCFFLDGLWKKKGGEENKSDDNSEGTSSTKKSSPFSSFSNQFSFPNLDAKRISMVQEILAKQPPEKQKELMEQALKFQQGFSKIPGFKKFAERQSKLVETLMANQPHSNMTSDFPSSPLDLKEEGSSHSVKSNHSGSGNNLYNGGAAGGSSLGRREGKKRGPTLDELKKVHLGDEIEELFAELRLIREKKNEYREKFHIASVQLRELQAEKQKLEQTERQVREKLKKSEQEVIILNTETMELEDKAKKATALLKKHEQWKREYDALKSKTEEEQVKGSVWFKEMERQLRQKEDALQSLQRKLHRLRRNDPLLQFSIACSEWQRLSEAMMAVRSSGFSRSSSLLSSSSSVSSEDQLPSASASQAVASPSTICFVKEKQQEAFETLQENFHIQQRIAWLQACRQQHAAARVLVQAAHGFLFSVLPFSGYDACITITSSSDAEQAEREEETIMSDRENGPNNDGASSRLRKNRSRRMRVDEVMNLFQDYGFVVEILKKPPLSTSSATRTTASSTVSSSLCGEDNGDHLRMAEGEETPSPGTLRTYQLLVRKPLPEEGEKRTLSPSFIRSLSGPYTVALAAYFCAPPVPCSTSEKSTQHMPTKEEDTDNPSNHFIEEERVSSSAPSSSTASPVLLLDKVVPYFSSSLLQDRTRTVIHYETARASGPGGQAVNVAETQVHAKVLVDGEVAFTASAQDSRSALQNKKNVEEQLLHRKRNQFNEQALSVLHPDVVRTQLVGKLATEWSHCSGRERHRHESGTASRGHSFSRVEASSSSLTATEVREEALSLLKEACVASGNTNRQEYYHRGSATIAAGSIFPLDYSVAQWAHQLTASHPSSSPSSTEGERGGDSYQK